MKHQGTKQLIALISVLCLILTSNSESRESNRVIDGLSSSSSSSSIDQNVEEKHFVLVHGASHGAWCWYRVAALLQSYGHRFTALDLAASGINPKQVNDVHSVSDYFNPLMEFMEKTSQQGERVILVGHSLGGLALSKAMESFPRAIAAAVFVTAMMPGPSLNVSTLQRESLGSQGPQVDNVLTYGNGPNKPPTSFSFGPKFMASNVYQLSPLEDLTLATTLVRPLHLFTEEELSREIVLTGEKYGTVPRVFIVSEEDKLIREGFVRWMLENNPPDMVLRIKGSDHMVMFSKAKDLCFCLLKVAKFTF